jgi:hypothetical protein
MSSAARISPWFVCLASALLPACGARSGLEQGPPFDAGVDAFAFDARVDAFMPDAAPECRVDGDCSDRIDCTDDRCVAGSCTHTGVASRCDDGLFCNGVETCSTTAGCVSPGRVCDDTVMCTVDICDEARDRCAASPDDTLCPVSFRCDGDRGCLARALVHDSFNLYEVDLPGGDERLIGRLPLRMTDIALAPDGTIYGADGDNLVRVDIDTMMFTTIMPVSTAFNGLDTAPDGTLYGAANTGVYRFDIPRGTATLVANFPMGYASSGDLAFIGPRLLATASGGGIEDDTLVEIALDGSPSRTIGIVTGFQNIWGLAPRGDLLFGFTAGGEMMRIDVRTGTPTLIVERVVHGFWGAAAR